MAETWEIINNTMIITRRRQVPQYPLLALLIILSLVLASAAAPKTAGELQVGDADGVKLVNEVEVNIFNRLGGGKVLGLHCQSKDNDLGPQTLADGGEYSWSFRTNVWGSTLFYCNLISGTPAAGGTVTFSAFDYQRDWNRCQSLCEWLLASEGIYAKDEATGLWEYFYSWTN